MSTPEDSNMPSLWVFLVIVLAVLLAVVIGTSFVMHMIQRRQRTQLERRIANGEVDLEALGIKRLNIPQEEIEKMPQHIFKAKAEEENKGGAQNSFYQPTCSICLDDFIFDQTQVRELPCKHIFHPECIDPFLRDNSSLCPLCKRSALPVGYCPVQVTNVMVRRERLTRRFREGRHTFRPHTRYVPPNQNQNAWQRGLDRIRGPSFVAAPPRAVVRHGDPTEISAVTDTEMGPVQSHDTQRLDAEDVPADIARRGTMARRAWRRERLASRQAQEYDQQAEEAQRMDAHRPLWRRLLGLS